VAGGAVRRLVWLAFGAALIGFAIYEVVVHDLGPLPIVALVVLPDLTFLAGAGQPHQPGQLPPRAVPLYNLAHRPLVPVVLIVATLVVLVAIRLAPSSPEDFEAARHVPLIAYVAGLAWLAHIALDRAFGFGLRTPDGWQRGWPGAR
jgi:hypothetical protein